MFADRGEAVYLYELGKHLLILQACDIMVLSGTWGEAILVNSKALYVHGVIVSNQ